MKTKAVLEFIVEALKCIAYATVTAAYGLWYFFAPSLVLIGLFVLLFHYIINPF